MKLTTQEVYSLEANYNVLKRKVENRQLFPESLDEEMTLGFDETLKVKMDAPIAHHVSFEDCADDIDPVSYSGENERQDIENSSEASRRTIMSKHRLRNTRTWSSSSTCISDDSSELSWHGHYTNFPAEYSSIDEFNFAFPELDPLPHSTSVKTAATSLSRAGTHMSAPTSPQLHKSDIVKEALEKKSEASRKIAQLGVCIHDTPCNQNVVRSNQWSRIEDVILVGVVFERFFDQGSLSNGGNRGNDDACWSVLKGKYEKLLAIYAHRYKRCHEFKERTAMAISRHYKVMKARVADDGGSSFRQDFIEYEKLALLAPGSESNNRKTRSRSASTPNVSDEDYNTNKHAHKAQSRRKRLKHNDSV
eukprot:CAMPEP_0204823136 /NCGR_PEP_ID=MMETSP1346-20131115/1254_1 /ASSEMBLY_ACC=CAM_ASM_000771 /TAXON_ID=215587 /ORGANISM="Aplanochytrium stocchinoi, Strain GSBS06" /LENGTH=362 /DNA_ID=CAMNT_0051949675 /DNA_START=267 /DNA_END=1355 /DNA_ORIENTATION=+